MLGFRSNCRSISKNLVKSLKESSLSYIKPNFIKIIYSKIKIYVYNINKICQLEDMLKKQWSDGGAKRAFDQIKIDLNSSSVLTNIANSLKTQFGTTNICNSNILLNGNTPSNLSKLNMLKKYGIGYKKVYPVALQ